MAKTAGTLKWDAWATPIYLIVRPDLDQWRVAKQLSGWPEPCRRAANTPSFYSPSHDCLSVSKLLIKGICRNGKTFRPNDWAERLCSAVVVFLPDATLLSGAYSSIRRYHGYSSYVRPAFINGTRCVIIDARLRDLEPRAWDYAIGFAHDNDLVTLDFADIVATPALPETILAAA